MGWRDDWSWNGKGALMLVTSTPGAGVEPEEPSATSLVYNWANFLAPVSTRRAVSSVSWSDALNAIEAFSRSRASL